MKKTIILLVFTAFISCNNKTKKSDYSKKTNVTKKLVTNNSLEGKKLMETRCFLCHNTSTPYKERVAPPMIAIKAHYITQNTSQKVFTDNLLAFLKKPTKENAKMKGAVKKYGIMPYQNFTEEDIKKIANYLYNYQIEEPEWFKKHWQEKHKTPYINKGQKIVEQEKEKTKSEIGLSYALGTKKILGKNLMGTIQKKGTLEALKFCNEKAYPLTDSMSVKFNATIKRVSDRPRNSNNLANKKELTIINQYKKIVSEKGKITPITENTNGKIQFYYPIVTNSMCLQCHGKPNDQIKPAVLSKLSELYPKDKAKGYEANQVRGIWSITFNE